VRRLLGVVPLVEQIGDLVCGQGSSLHGRTDLALPLWTMAGSALGLLGGGSIGGKGRQSDRDRQRADNKQNNEFRKSHEIAPPVMSTEINQPQLLQRTKNCTPYGHTPNVISLT